MSRVWKVVAVIVVVGFVVFLAWSTMSAQRVQCEVCVEYNGRQNCAAASADTEEEAARSAQTTACGPLVGGMDDAIACSNRLPVRRQCRIP